MDPTTFMKLITGGGYRSLRQLSQALYKQLDEQTRPPKERSFEMSLRRLAQGDDRWFRNRSIALDKLAELLGCDPEDLLSAAQQQAEEFPFEDFPRLRPLNLRAEMPWPIAHFEPTPPRPLWNFEASQRLDYATLKGVLKSGAHWLMAPPGAGKRLLARWLFAQDPTIRLQQFGRLRDAASALAPHDGTTLILVAGSDAEGDEAALQRLLALERVCVLAAFPLPGRQSSGDPDGPTLSGAVATKSPRFIELRWVPFGKWRDESLRHIGNRLESKAGLFDAGQMQKWLQENDPFCTLVKTPGDLLPICALVDEHGPNYLKRRSAADLAGGMIAGKVDGMREQRLAYTWLRSSALPVFIELVRSQLEALEVPLLGGVPRQQWARWIPSEHTPILRDPQPVQELIESTHQAKSRKERARRIAEATRKLSAPTAGDAVEFLVQAQLLRTDASGHLAPAPKLAAYVCQWEAVREALQGSQPEKWGRWTLDSARAELVDDVLDTLPEDEFFQLLKRTVDTYALSRLGSVGAVEALFEATGRRLINGLRPSARQQRVLEGLWLCAEPSRTRYYPSSIYRLPATRTGSYCERQRGFVAACWAWSFWGLPQRELPSEDPKWLWPGWVALALSDLEPAYQVLQGENAWDGHGEVDRTALLGGWVLALVPELLARCSDFTFPQKLPDLVLPDALIFAAKKGVLPDPESIASDHEWRILPWNGRLLAAKARELTAEQKSRLADLLILEKFSAGFSPGYFMKNWNERHPELYAELAPMLSPARLRKCIGDMRTKTILKGCDYLPKHLHSAVADHILERPDGMDSRWLNYMDGNPDSKSFVLGLLLRHVELRRDYDWDFARKIWWHFPVIAQKTALQEFLRDPDSELTSHWFGEAPRDMAVRRPLIEAVCKVAPRQPSDWLRRWLLRMLPTAGPLADTVYALMRGETPMPISVQ